MALYAFNPATAARRKRIPNPIGLFDGREVIDGEYLIVAELPRHYETDGRSRGFAEVKEDQ
jgi:hypothetical protein